MVGRPAGAAHPIRRLTVTADMADRLQGRVVLSIRVGVDGRVESLKVSRSSGVRSMDESALKTVKDWRFEPAKRFGRPVVMEIRHAIRFEFQED